MDLMTSFYYKERGKKYLNWCLVSIPI